MSSSLHFNEVPYILNMRHHKRNITIFYTYRNFQKKKKLLLRVKKRTLRELQLFNDVRHSFVEITKKKSAHDDNRVIIDLRGDDDGERGKRFMIALFTLPQIYS